MLHVVATAIITGSDVVRLTSRNAAAGIGCSQDGMTRAVRDLKRFISADVRDRQFTLFQLGSDWYDEQMALPFPSGKTVDYFACTENPGTPAWENSARCTENPGTSCTENPGTLPGKTVQSRGKVPSRAWENSARCTENPGTETQVIEMGTRARIESNRIEDSAGTEVYLVIEKAFHSVEIPPELQEDAEILSDVILSHRINFDSAAGAASQRDRKVIARLLAIAPLERLCDVVAELNTQGIRPGKSDMWYFSVLLSRIHGIHHTITDAVIKQAKSKALSNKTEAPLFADQLLADIDRQARRLA